LETQVYSNKDYSQQVYLLSSRLRDLETKLEEIERWSSVGISRRDRSQVYQPEVFDNKTRFTLLGARALIEFKVGELYHALDGLTDGGQDRQAMLEIAAQKAEILAEEVTKIRGILQPRMYPGEAIIGRESAQVTPIIPRIQERSIQLTHDNLEKDQPSLVLTKASADADQIKAGKESVQKKEEGNLEAEFSVEELKRRMEEVTKQATALRQLVSEVIQKADTIKKQERNTDSKLSDMKQLKRTWETKKIPVNKEIEAVENKLATDMATYIAVL
jgi:hypothetical protein